MADLGHQLTDEELKKLEREIAREYRTAVKDMQKKLEAYLEKTEDQRKIQEALYKAGKITKEEYQNWCFRHEMVGKRWEQMRDVLAGDMVNTNKIALKMTKDKMPDVYALNCNYATYQIEHDGKIDTGFTLYNHDTAEYLLGDQRQLMPKPSTRKAKEIAANKDMQWNMKKIQSAVLQGVLQGESPYDVAKRLERVGQMNHNASVRYARTMTTSAQNAGRYEAYRRATKLGVDLTIEWQATLDGRTRHDHRMMHGKRTEVDKPFHTPDGFTIYYPADCTGESDAPQSEIWNCRCTLLSWVKGFEGDTVKTSPKMEGKTFEEWQNEKAPKKQELRAREPRMDFSGVDNATAEEYKKAVDKLLAEYPLRNHPIESVTDFRTAWGLSRDVDIDDFMDEHNQWEGVGAIFYPNDTQYPGAKKLSGAHIIMYEAEQYTSSPLKEQLESLADLRERNGWHGKQDSFFNLALGKEGAATHEYGHAIANDCGLYYGQKHYPELENIFKKYTGEEIGRDISTYATTNPQEMMAEAFVAYQEPRMRTPIVNEIMELVFKRRRA